MLLCEHHLGRNRCIDIKVVHMSFMVAQSLIFGGVFYVWIHETVISGAGNAFFDCHIKSGHSHFRAEAGNSVFGENRCSECFLISGVTRHTIDFLYIDISLVLTVV